MKRKPAHTAIFTAIWTLVLVFTVIPAGAANPPDVDLVDMTYSSSHGLLVLSRYELFMSGDGTNWKPAGLMDRATALSSLAVSGERSSSKSPRWSPIRSSGSRMWSWMIPVRRRTRRI